MLDFGFRLSFQIVNLALEICLLGLSLGVKFRDTPSHNSAIERAMVGALCDVTICHGVTWLQLGCRDADAFVLTHLGGQITLVACLLRVGRSLEPMRKIRYQRFPRVPGDLRSMLPCFGIQRITVGIGLALGKI